MKRYLLDTSLVAAFLHRRSHVIELIDPWVRKQEAATSILVYGEVIEYLNAWLIMHGTKHACNVCLP